MSFVSLLTGSFRNVTFTGSEGTFIETEDYEKGFAEHYKKRVWPHVAAFEKARMVALEEASRRINTGLPFIVFLAIAAVFTLCQVKGGYNNDIHDHIVISIAFGFVGIIFVAVSWIYKSVKAYQASIKHQIFPEIISFFGNYKYSPLYPASVENLMESEIIPINIQEKNENWVTGEYKGVSIDLFETKLWQRQGKDTVMVMWAVIISLSVNKKFLGKTVIKHHKLIKKSINGLKDVKLEDPNFAKIFNIFSNDQVEARYLLTPSFMERLIQLYNSYSATNIEGSFYDNKLLMAVPLTKSLFILNSVYEPEDFINDSKMILRQMHSLLQIVDILKLNEKI